MSSAWSNRVRIALQQGYGVEDIAVTEGCSVEHVRLEVRILREAGVFKPKWFFPPAYCYV